MGKKKKKRQPEPEQRQPRLNRRQLLGLAAAWDAAAKETDRAVKQAGGLTPRWVKADVVYLSEEISAGELAKSLKSSRQEFFRYGLAFDAGYETALLEAELNGAKIYDYEENPGIDLEYLNTYLKKAGWPARLRGLLFPAAAVLLTGAGVYQRLTERDQAACSRRTFAQYIATRVRQADCLDGVSVEDFDGVPALTLWAEDGYVTRVYWYDGYLMELYTDVSSRIPPAEGDRLMEAGGPGLSLADGMLTVDLTDAAGAQERLELSLRSGEGAAS